MSDWWTCWIVFQGTIVTGTVAFFKRDPTMDSVFEREDSTEFQGSASQQMNGPARQIARRFWQPDGEAQVCSIANCDNVFTCSWGGERRHHCRQCGRVVCGSCSRAQVLHSSGTHEGNDFWVSNMTSVRIFLPPRGQSECSIQNKFTLAFSSFCVTSENLPPAIYKSKTNLPPWSSEINPFLLLPLTEASSAAFGGEGSIQSEWRLIEPNWADCLFFLTDLRASAANESMWRLLSWLWGVLLRVLFVKFDIPIIHVVSYSHDIWARTHVKASQYHCRKLVPCRCEHTHTHNNKT